MADTDRLAALLCDLFPTAERSRWPFSVQLAAERLAAAGVTVAQPTPDALRAAAQAVVQAEHYHRQAYLPPQLEDAIAALRAALAGENRMTTDRLAETVWGTRPTPQPAPDAKPSTPPPSPSPPPKGDPHD